MGLKNDATNTVKEEKLFYQGEIIGKGKEYLGKKYTYNVKVVSGNKTGQGSTSIEVYKNLPVMGNDGTVSPELEEGDTVFLSFMNKNNNDPVIVSNNISKSYNIGTGNNNLVSTSATDESGLQQIDFSVLSVSNEDIKKCIFVWPCPSSNTITSLFGYRISKKQNHTGIDINAAEGSSVISATDGQVVDLNANGDGGGYGYYVEISTKEGILTKYCHGSQILVTKGQEIKAGDTIMKSGHTGGNYGPHLHFEIKGIENSKTIFYNPRLVKYTDGDGTNENIFKLLLLDQVNEYEKIG